MSKIPSECVGKVAEAMGDKVTKEDLKQIAEEVEKLQKQAEAAGIPPSQSLHHAGRTYAEKVQLAAMIAKRNATINTLRFEAVLQYVRSTWKGKEGEGLRAVLTGSVEGRKGARASVAGEQRWLRDHYLGTLDDDLRTAGVRDLFKSGTLDRDISRALWQLNTQTPNVNGIAKDAVTIAKALHKAQETARAHANAAGAWIGKLEGWIVRQSHDAWKIQSAGEKAWIDHILPKLDWGRIEAEQGVIADRQRWLREVYTGLASGVHLKTPAAPNTSGFKGPRNIAKGMSQERVLHFTDADAWFDYNEKFGSGNVREAAFHGLMRSAQNTGAMRILGTNPEALFGRLVSTLQEDIRSTGDTKAMTKLAEAANGSLKNRLDEVLGTTSMPVNGMLARRAATVRSLKSMSALGGAVISSVTDLANFASELHYQGRPFLSGMGEAIQGLAAGRAQGERKQILSSLGVFFDSLIGDVTRVGSLDESLPGAMSRLQQRFFDLNLLNWWTESLRGAGALSMSHDLALNAGKSFDQLRPELQRTLGLFSIDAADWEHMRAAGLRKAEDGADFMVPDGMDPARADKLRRYISDRTYTATLEPDADTRAMMRQGTRPGTAVGELMRFIFQFKGYPVAFTRNVLGREIFGYGEKAFAQGSVQGIASLIATTTVLGYGAMVVKDLLKGRNPRDPRDPKTMVSALLQGGGGGIYGDFLFGDYSRFGRSALETAAGPTLSLTADTIALGQGLVRGNKDAGDALRLAFDNTPYLNLFYSRVLLNYLILYQIQEAMAPGTLRRMESRIESQNNQTFWLPPSEAVR